MSYLACRRALAPGEAPALVTRLRPAELHAGQLLEVGGLHVLPAWADCAVIKRQSPVNIADATGDLKATPLHLDLKPTPIHLLNNGHTLEIEYGAGSTIRWRGATYQLLQFHFHTLSEHVVRGHHFAMEMHAVFKNPATSQYVVLGEFFRIGSKSTFLSRFQSLLPEHNGGHADSGLDGEPGQRARGHQSLLDLQGLVDHAPCSPVVTWIVLKRSATASRHQIQGEFYRIMGNNFRPPAPERPDHPLHSLSSTAAASRTYQDHSVRGSPVLRRHVHDHVWGGEVATNPRGQSIQGRLSANETGPTHDCSTDDSTPITAPTNERAKQDTNIDGARRAFSTGTVPFPSSLVVIATGRDPKLAFNDLVDQAVFVVDPS